MSGYHGFIVGLNTGIGLLNLVNGAYGRAWLCLLTAVAAGVLFRYVALRKAVSA
jgi:hypothetical protein